MCCSSVSSIYFGISVTTFVLLFILYVINLAIFELKYKEIFQMKNFTDYEQEFSLSFLVNMTFGVKLSNRDDYGITSGYTKNVCYTGKCSNDNKTYTSTPNCTQACFDNLTYCYNLDKIKCKFMSCSHDRD